MDRFIDTSGWAAWADRRDSFHAMAVQAVDDLWRHGGRLVTTNWIVDELTALLTSPIRMSKLQQIQLVRDIRLDAGVFIIRIDRETESKAWALWESRTDKNWTLTDCTSFIVMQDHNLTEAITADRHFEQAGYVRLLK